MQISQVFEHESFLGSLHLDDLQGTEVRAEEQKASKNARYVFR